jgi:Ni/Co efflux regulator RcnB
MKMGRRLRDVGEASSLCPPGRSKARRFAHAALPTAHFERNDITINARRCTRISHSAPGPRPARAETSDSAGRKFVSPNLVQTSAHFRSRHNYLMDRRKQWIMNDWHAMCLRIPFRATTKPMTKPMTNNAMQRRIYARQRAHNLAGPAYRATRTKSSWSARVAANAVNIRRNAEELASLR